MRIRIWNNMANIKFKAIYTNECSRRADLTGRGYSFFLSFASASTVAAWTIWQAVPMLWASIVALAQILHLAKPYLPFMKHEKYLSHKSVQFFIIDDDIITSDNTLSNQQIQSTAKSAAADIIVTT